MNILISDLTTSINKCEKCRKMSKNIGKVTFIKNKQPDSVFLPIAKYERRPKVLDKSNNSNKPDIVEFVHRLPSAGKREVYTLDQLKNDLYLCNDL